MLIGVGFAVGALSGFFGIGGGFLIVPGLMGATAMPLINAIGSSLVSVTAFGLTTAASYAWSGLVDWPLAVLFIVGGALGGLLGIRLAHHLAPATSTRSRSPFPASSLRSGFTSSPIDLGLSDDGLLMPPGRDSAAAIA